MKRRIAVWLSGLLMASFAAAQPRLTLQKTIDLITLYKENLRSEEQTIQWITGVDFEWSTDNVAALKKAGATDAILNRIHAVAPKTRSSPEGVLTIGCAPAECEIHLNGQTIGATTNGTMSRRVAAGDVVVDLIRPGYTSQQKAIRVGAGAENSLTVTLEPTSETRAALGARVAANLFRASGAENLEQLVDLQGSGGLDALSGSKSRQWNFAFAIAGPRDIEIVADGVSGGLGLRCEGERCDQLRKGSRLSPPRKRIKDSPEQLETALRTFAQYHYGAILRDISQPGVRYALASAAGGETHLIVDARDTQYDLALGPDFLPKLVRCSPKSGLAATTIVFADFVKIAQQFQYPRRTQVRIEGAQNGIQVSLESINRTPTLKK